MLYSSFWHGLNAANAAFGSQCAFMTQTNPNQLLLTQGQFIHFLQQAHMPGFIINYFAKQAQDTPLHALPHEYPFLSIFIFSIGLFGRMHYYQLVFGICALLVTALVYGVLVRLKSHWAAWAFALYILTGTTFTLPYRFDIFPGVVAFFAVICAHKKKWYWAYILLAIATLLKYYPVLLMVPFLIAQQAQLQGKWYAWKRWQGAAIYGVICAGVMIVSLLLNVEGTIAPIGYFLERPVQVKSLSSSMIWLWSLARHSTDTMNYVYTFGSLNVLSPRSNTVSRLDSVLLVIGLLSVFWLQWRKKVDVATASLLVLLTTIVTGKVFSPQYLIWIVPMVAYVGGANIFWVCGWTAIGVLTTMVYPYIYWLAPLERVPLIPQFYPLITARNLVLLLLTFGSIVVYALRKTDKKDKQLLPTANVPNANREEDEATEKRPLINALPPTISTL